MKPNRQNPYFSNLSAALSLFAAGLLVALGTTAAFAASATWNVATSGDWSTDTNWNPSAPGALGYNVANTITDTAGFGGSTNYTVYLSGIRSIAAQTFSNTGTTNLLGGTAAIAASETLYLYSGITINAGSGAVTIGDTAASPTRKVDIRTGSYTIANNSSSLLTIANGLGSRGTGSTTTITLGGTGNTTVSGTVGGGAGATVALTKSGSGTVTLSGNNTFGGLLTISAGTLTVSGAANTSGGNVTLSGTTAGTQLNLNSATALGAAASALTISGGDNAKIDNTSGAAITITNNNPQLWNNNFAFVGSNDLNMGAGNITIGGTRQVTVTAKSLTLGGVITDGTNAFGLTKAGAGTLILTKANTYDGTTTVSGGVLRAIHADALGVGTTSGTTVTAGSLEIANGITSNSAETITIAGSGENNTGALRAGSSGGTWSGQVILGAAPRLGATTGNALTITGSIVNGGTNNTFAVSGQSGSGVVILNPTASNTYSGKTDIIRGILQPGKTDALPVGTILDVDSVTGVGDVAIFNLAGVNQTVAGLQDTATDTNAKVWNSVASTTSTLSLNQSTNTTFDGIIENGSGTVALVKDGGGTLTLNGANSYNGTTSLNAGGLVVNGTFASNVNAAAGTSLTFGAASSTSGTSVSVASGAILNFAGTSATAALTIAAGSILTGEGALTGTASLTFAAGTSTLQFNANTPGSLTVPSVTATGATIMVTPQGTLTTGNTYLVLTNSAGFSGTPAPTYVPSSRGTLAFGGPLSGELPTELLFTAAAPVTTLIWKGNAANPTLWDINTTANWDSGSGADVFFDFDSVAFDDSATNTTISIQPATISAGALSFNNPTKNYNISGGGISGTAALVKNGSAALTLSNANSFTGGTTLNAGTLNINNASALGTVAVGLIINGGTIDNTSGAAITTVSYPLAINTDVTFTGSNDLNLGAGATTLGTPTATSRTITTTAGTLRLGGAIADGSGGANQIVKAGNGTLTLASASSSYTGLTMVSAGTLKLGASSGATSGPLGSTSIGTELTSGATIDFAGFGVNIEPVSIAGTGVGGNGALVNSGGDQTNAIRFLTLTANASVGATGNRFDIRGASGASPGTLSLNNHTLTKTGSGYFAIVNTTVDPGTGHIDIVGGKLGLHATNTLNGDASNTITVRSGATLDCYEAGTWNSPVWTVLMDAGSSFTNSNGTASWNGTVTLNGAANIGGSTTLTLNGAISGTSGALTKTGAGLLTLAGTAANTYGGTTTVDTGFLYLNKPVGTNAVPGDVSIVAGGMTLVAADQIPDTATVTLTAATSKFNINAKSETIANVDVQNANTITSEGLVTGANGKLTITGTLTHTAGSITLNSSGVGNSSIIEANTVINNGGSWVFGAVDGTQKLIVGSGGLTIGGGSTIAVNALVGTADNFISLAGDVTSTAATTTNTISGLGKLNLNATRTFTVADDAPASDLTVSTTIADGTGTGALVKEGAGTLTLNAVNTYTGTTTVNTGTLGGNGTIAGPVIIGSSGTIAPGTATGTLTVASADLTAGGTLAIEINDVSTPKTDTLAVAGELKLTNAKLNISITGLPTQLAYTIATAGTVTGTFAPANITGLPSGYSLAYTSTQVQLVKSGFDSWIGTNFPTLPDKTAGGDPDNDGMKNLLEYVLNGNPGLSDLYILPDLDASGANFVFTFTRRIDSKEDTTQTFQYDADLVAPWTDILIPNSTIGNVQITPVDAQTEEVKITISKGSNTTLFGRLQVVK